jgi:hypothetical protein
MRSTRTRFRSIAAFAFLAAAFIFTALATLRGSSAADSKPHGPNLDQINTAHRGDVRSLPDPIRNRLVELAGRPHTFAPLTVFSEAPSPSRLLDYALLDTTGFPPNDFTSIVAGVNDGVAPTAANCANRGLATIGGVRVVLEPKPGLPTDPKDAGSFIDVFTDVSGLFVINNESGWYEGWMIHDLVVPPVLPAREDRHAQFGSMTAEDAAAITRLGTGNDVPGNIFSTDGLPTPTPKNRVKIYLSMGAWNALQQSDAHSYWEFNPYTNWVAPPIELPSTDGETGCASYIPDDPIHPRDPDRLLDTSLNDLDCPTVPNDDHKETRLRFLPSGLSNEILLDVFVRVASFEPGVTDFAHRVVDAQIAEIARIDTNHDGRVDAVEADIEGTSDGGQSNDRLFIPVTDYTRFAVTREINDGLLQPRFVPRQTAWVLSGNLIPVNPAVPASVPQDADNR